MTTKDGIPNNDYSFNSNKINNIPKRPQLKHLDLMHSAPKEWSSMADHGDDNHDFLMQYFSSYPGLESYKLKLVKTSFQSQDMLLLSKCFVSFVNLRHFDIEFLNCEIDDLKFGICMYSLSQIPQLKYIRFKIIQKTQISIDYIEKSIEKVSNMINLEKFDFYFRKQTILARERTRLEKVFLQFKNVHCSFSPQSLHIYRTDNEIDQFT